LTLCQIVASFLIVIVSLLNLTLTDHDKALWSTLVGVGFGYLVLNPRLKRVVREDEPIHDIAAKQQIDGPVAAFRYNYETGIGNRVVQNRLYKSTNSAESSN